MKRIVIENLIYLDACTDTIRWFISKDTTDFHKLYELAKQDGKLHHINWYITKLMTKEQLVKYAVFSAESTIYIWENFNPDDDRPQLAIQAAKNYLNNQSDDNDNNSDDAGHAAAFADDDAGHAAALAAAFAYAAAYDDRYDYAYAADAARYAAVAAYPDDDDTSRNEYLISIIDYGISILLTENNK